MSKLVLKPCISNVLTLFIKRMHDNLNLFINTFFRKTEHILIENKANLKGIFSNKYIFKDEYAAVDLKQSAKGSTFCRKMSGDFIILCTYLCLSIAQSTWAMELAIETSEAAEQVETIFPQANQLLFSSILKLTLAEPNTVQYARDYLDLHLKKLEVDDPLILQVISILTKLIQPEDWVGGLSTQDDIEAFEVFSTQLETFIKEHKAFRNSLEPVVKDYRKYAQDYKTSSLERERLVAPKALLLAEGPEMNGMIKSYRVSQAKALKIGSLTRFGTGGFGFRDSSTSKGKHSIVQDISKDSQVAEGVVFSTDTDLPSRTRGEESAFYWFSHLLFGRGRAPLSLVALGNIDGYEIPENSEISKTLSLNLTSGMTHSEFLASNPQWRSVLKPKKYSIALQASSYVRGKSLNEYIRPGGVQKEWSINGDSFSEQIILSLLTMASCEPDHLVYKPDATLEVIDTISVFERPVQKIRTFLNPGKPDSAVRHHIFFHNVLFLLPDMGKPVSNKAIDAIEELDADFFIVQWLALLKSQESRYHAFKNHSFLNSDLKEEPFISSNIYTDSLGLPVSFDPELILEISTNIKKLQTFLKSNKTATHAQLFSLLHPIAAHYYKVCKDTQGEGDILETFYRKIYQRSIKSSFFVEDVIDGEMVIEGMKVKEHLAKIEIATQPRKKYMISELAQLVLSHVDLEKINEKNKVPAFLKTIYTAFRQEFLAAKEKGTLHRSWQKPALILRPSVGGDGKVLIWFIENGVNTSPKELSHLLSVIKKSQFPHSGTHKDETVLDVALKKGNRKLVGALIDADFFECDPQNALKYYQTILKAQPTTQKDLEAFNRLIDSNQEVEWVLCLENMLPKLKAKAPGKELSDVFKTGATQGSHRQLAQVRQEDPILPGREYGLYLKAKPDLPGFEEAAGSFMRRLFGFGAPNTLFLKLLLNEMHTPVMLSLKMRGPTLLEAFETESVALRKLNQRKFSGLTVATMLTNPEDGKPDNYIISKDGNTDSYSIACVDNDHSFIDSVSYKPRASFLRVKSILYCFDQMRDPIDRTIAQQILETDPESFLRDWLEGLATKHDQYLKMFTAEEHRRYVETGCFTDGVPLVPKIIVALYDKFILLQALIRKNPNSTHIDLLCALEPSIGAIYKNVLESKETPLERFRIVDGPFYTSTASHRFTTLSSTRNILAAVTSQKETVLESWEKGELFSPLGAWRQFKERLNRITLETVIPSYETNPLCSLIALGSVESQYLRDLLDPQLAKRYKSPLPAQPISKLVVRLYDEQSGKLAPSDISDISKETVNTAVTFDIEKKLFKILIKIQQYKSLDDFSQNSSLGNFLAQFKALMDELVTQPSSLYNKKIMTRVVSKLHEAVILLIEKREQKEQDPKSLIKFRAAKQGFFYRLYVLLFGDSMAKRQVLDPKIKADYEFLSHHVFESAWLAKGSSEAEAGFDSRAPTHSMALDTARWLHLSDSSKMLYSSLLERAKELSQAPSGDGGLSPQRVPLLGLPDLRYKPDGDPTFNKIGYGQLMLFCLLFGLKNIGPIDVYVSQGSSLELSIPAGARSLFSQENLLEQESRALLGKYTSKTIFSGKRNIFYESSLMTEFLGPRLREKILALDSKTFSMQLLAAYKMYEEEMLPLVGAETEDKLIDPAAIIQLTAQNLLFLQKRLSQMRTYLKGQDAGSYLQLLYRVDPRLAKEYEPFIQEKRGKPRPDQHDGDNKKISFGRQFNFSTASDLAISSLKVVDLFKLAKKGKLKEYLETAISQFAQIIELEFKKQGRSQLHKSWHDDQLVLVALEHEVEDFVITFLINLGLKRAVYNESKNTVLHALAKNNRSQTVQKLILGDYSLAESARKFDVVNQNGVLPLNLALQAKNISLIAALTSLGVRRHDPRCLSDFYLGVAKHPNFDEGSLKLILDFSLRNRQMAWAFALARFFSKSEEKKALVRFAKEQLSASAEQGYRNFSKERLLLQYTFQLNPEKIETERTISLKLESDVSDKFSQIATLSNISITSFPKLPYMNEAVGSFIRKLLGGWGAPQTELIQIGAYPALITQFIGSETLLSVANDIDEKSINLSDFTGLFIATLILRPQIVRSHNIIVEKDAENGKYRLWQHGVNTIMDDNCSSALYCLTLMHEKLDPIFRASFLSLDVEQFCTEWVESLIRLERNLNALVPAEVRFTYSKMGSFFNLLFQEGDVVRIVQTFYELKDLLRTYPEITHQDLLKKIELSRGPSFPSSFLSEKSKLIDRLRSHDLPVLLSKTSTGRAFIPSEIVGKGLLLSGADLVKELRETFGRFKPSTGGKPLPAGLMKKSEATSAKQKVPPKPEVLPSKQIVLLKAIDKHLRIFKAPGYSELTSYKMLKLLTLFRRMRVIDFSGCNNIDDDDIAKLASHSDALEELDISQIESLKELSAKTAEGTKPLFFPKLVRLYANNCTKLRRIFIAASSLSTAKFNGCADLKSKSLDEFIAINRKIKKLEYSMDRTEESRIHGFAPQFTSFELCDEVGLHHDSQRLYEAAQFYELGVNFRKILSIGEKEVRSLKEEGPRDTLESEKVTSQEARLKKIRARAKAGDAAASFELGVCYREGLLGLARSPKKAASCAAKAGSRDFNFLKYLKTNVFSVPNTHLDMVDWKRAFALYHAAAKLGHNQARATVLFAIKRLSVEQLEVLTKKSLNFTSFLKIAAQSGDNLSFAKFNYAQCLERGLGVDKSLEQAILYYYEAEEGLPLSDQESIFLVKSDATHQKLKLLKFENKVLPALLQEAGLTPKDAHLALSQLKPVLKKGQIEFETDDLKSITQGIARAFAEYKIQSVVSRKVLKWENLLQMVLGKRLSLKNRLLTSGDFALVQRLSTGNQHLKKIHFEGIKLTLTDIAVISSIGQIKQLTLENAGITDEGLKILANHPNLYELSLPTNECTAQGVQCLLANQKLRKVCLRANPLKDEGAEVLAKHSSIIELHAGECKIGDRGCAALARSPELRTVLLAKNHIGETGARAFLTNSHLESLDLSHNPIPSELAKAIEFYISNNTLLKGARRMQHPLGMTSASKKKIRILALDGGGIRGFFQIKILKYLANAIRERMGKEFNIPQAFDLIAGTSTGGIIALALTASDDNGATIFDIGALENIFGTLIKKVSTKPSVLAGILGPKSNADALEKALFELFGNRTLRQSLTHVMIPTYDLNTEKPYLFDSVEASKSAADNWGLVAAARATSSAPTYFSAVKEKNSDEREFSFIDGEFYARDPSLLALMHARQLYPHAEEFELWSIGTGIRPDLKNDTDLSNAGAIQRLGIAPKLLLKEATQYTAKLLAELVRFDSRIKMLRLQPLINQGMILDDASADIISHIVLLADSFIEENRERLYDFVSSIERDFKTSL